MPQIRLEDFEYYYRKHFDALAQYVFFKVDHISDAEDIVQTVFEKFYHALRKHSRDIDNIEAYLTQMANFELSRYYKVQSKKNVYLDDPSTHFEEENESQTLEEEILDKCEIEHLIQKVKELPQDEQKILVAKLKWEMTFQEMAQAFKRPENSIKTQYYRILKKLRDTLVSSERSVYESL